jgi:ABC-type polysaccharide/polyol phosphate export permease
VRWSLDLMRTLSRHELSLMEQGTPFGFFLSFANNVLMLFIFHTLFVTRFLDGVPNPWLYLLLGIVQWNLYVNSSMAGFSCLIYRQQIVMGYSFPREILILARAASVFVPYLIELCIIAGLAFYFKIWPNPSIAFLPVFLAAQFLFTVGICFIFAFIGVAHKNIIPFWNLMFRVLSFATPIFYLPNHFHHRWATILYTWNPFTVFMLWIREMFNANGFELHINPLTMLLASLAVFLAGYGVFRKFETIVGDRL